MAATIMRPTRCEAWRRPLREHQTDVVHLDDDRNDPVDDRGDQHGDDHQDDRALRQAFVEHLLEGDHHDLRRQDEVRAHGPGDHLGLRFRPLDDRREVVVAVVVPMRHAMVDLLGSLEAEVHTTDHQDDLDEQRSDSAEHERRGEDQQQFVAERALGDLRDDRQLAVRGEALHVRRRHRRVVDDHAGRLHARSSSCRTDVVDRRCRQLGERCDVVE